MRTSPCNPGRGNSFPQALLLRFLKALKARCDLEVALPFVTGLDSSILQGRSIPIIEGKSPFFS
jgi:hypothetical protein